MATTCHWPRHWERLKQGRLIGDGDTSHTVLAWSAWESGWRLRSPHSNRSGPATLGTSGTSLRILGFITLLQPPLPSTVSAADGIRYSFELAFSWRSLNIQGKFVYLPETARGNMWGGCSILTTWIENSSTCASNQAGGGINKAGAEQEQIEPESERQQIWVLFSALPGSSTKSKPPAIPDLPRCARKEDGK